jgi:hypothetical protein
MTDLAAIVPFVSLGTQEEVVVREWQAKVVERLCDAEALLDWLEAQGYTDLEFDIVENAFEVRWR